MTATIGFVTQMAIPLDDCIAAADDFGFDYVEILMDGDEHRTSLAERTDAITEHVASRGLDLMVHLPFPIDLGGPHPNVREGGLAELKACIRTATDLGAHKGVVHPCTTAWGSAWDAEELRPGIRQSLANLQDFASAHEFELCAENIPGGVYSVAEFPELLAETDVSMTFDTGHAQLSGFSDVDAADFLSAHSSRVTHLHLNDNNGQTDQHLPLEACLLPTSSIPVAEKLRLGDGTRSAELAT